jgi:hypothetical protein
VSVAPPCSASTLNPSALPLHPVAFPARCSILPSVQSSDTARLSPMVAVVLPAVSSSSSFIPSSWPSPLTLLEPPDPTVPFPAKAGHRSLPGRHLSLIDSRAPGPCADPVPIYSALGSPLCAYFAGAFSLTFLDSGATYNLTGDRSLFVGPLLPADTPVTGVDSASALRATRFGSIRAVLGGGQTVTLTNSFFVPGLAHTLVSVRGLVLSPGASCTFTAQWAQLDILLSYYWAVYA